MSEYFILTVFSILAGFVFVAPVSAALLTFIALFVWKVIDRADSALKNPVVGWFGGMFCDRPHVKEHKGQFFVVINEHQSLNRIGDYCWYHSPSKQYPEYTAHATKAEAEEILKRYLNGELKKKPEATEAQKSAFLWVPALCAISIFLLGVLLQFAFWFTVYALSFVGVVFALRWIRDIQKYAVNLKSKLEAHKNDHEAHKVEETS